MTLTNLEIMAVLGVVSILIAVVTPVVKLNATITRLNTTLENFMKQTEDSHSELKCRVDEHGKEIDRMYTTLTEMKKDVGFNTKRIEECEIRKKLLRGEFKNEN